MQDHILKLINELDTHAFLFQLVLAFFISSVIFNGLVFSFKKVQAEIKLWRCYEIISRLIAVAGSVGVSIAIIRTIMQTIVEGGDKTETVLLIVVTAILVSILVFAVVTVKAIAGATAGTGAVTIALTTAITVATLGDAEIETIVLAGAGAYFAVLISLLVWYFCLQPVEEYQQKNKNY